jgi:hypothetical protein
MKKFALCLFLSLVFSVPALSEECTSKLQGFVNKTGYKIMTAQPCNVWLATDALRIPRGEGVVRVLMIGDGGEMGIVGTVLQSKAELNLSADLLRQLMLLNNELDYMKIGIDSDGDLFVRAEMRMSSLTAENFSATVKDVVRASNQIYDILKK